MVGHDYNKASDIISGRVRKIVEKDTKKKGETNISHLSFSNFLFSFSSQSLFHFSLPLSETFSFKGQNY